MIKVLLADDHAVLRDGLQSIVDMRHDMTVVAQAADGRSAIHAVREFRPDVVIMDIAMPLLNGIEATRYIREDFPATKIVMLSIHAGSEHVFRALQAGAHGYVLKESAGNEVIDAIRTVFQGHRFLSKKIADTVIDEYLRQSQTSQVKSPLEQLSLREREVLQLVAEGRSGAEIAGMIHLSPKTVETYRSRIMQKLAIKNLPELVRFAIQQGVISIE